MQNIQFDHKHARRKDDICAEEIPHQQSLKAASAHLGLELFSNSMFMFVWLYNEYKSSMGSSNTPQSDIGYSTYEEQRN
jgi:hypothetical protein